MLVHWRFAITRNAFHLVIMCVTVLRIAIVKAPLNPLVDLHSCRKVCAKRVLARRRSFFLSLFFFPFALAFSPLFPSALSIPGVHFLSSRSNRCPCLRLRRRGIPMIIENLRESYNGIVEIRKYKKKVSYVIN